METSDPIHPDFSGRFESLRAALLVLPSLARFQLADREDIVQTALNAVNERYSDRGAGDQHALAKRIAINEAWERIRGERVVPNAGAPPRLDDLAETPVAVLNPAELAEFRCEVARFIASALSTAEREVIVRGVVGTDRVATIAADLGITERTAYRLMQSALAKMHFALRDYRDLFA